MGSSTKTRKFLIATHGTFAQGAKSSLDIIAGAQDNVYLVQAYLDDINTLEMELDALLKSSPATEEWVVFTDLLGGSVTNQLARYAAAGNVHIIAGFNLPLLLEMILADTEVPVDAIVEEVLSRAREQMVYVNKVLSGPHNNDDEL